MVLIFVGGMVFVMVVCGVSGVVMWTVVGFGGYMVIVMVDLVNVIVECVEGNNVMVMVI